MEPVSILEGTAKPPLMPWRLVILLVIGSIVLIFIGLNLEQTSTINFGFTVAEDVPVPISLGTAFLVGVAISLPLALRRRPRSGSASRRETPKKKTDAAADTARATHQDSDPSSRSQDGEKRRGIRGLFRRRPAGDAQEPGSSANTSERSDSSNTDSSGS